VLCSAIPFAVWGCTQGEERPGGEGGTQALRAEVEAIVDAVVRPLIEEHAIPGMAVALILGGERHSFEYGLAAVEEGRPVTHETLFELGSVSKVYTAALAASAVVSGTLSLSDPVGRHLPELQGSALDAVPLLDLGTYTAGGLPLQFPGEVTDDETMVAFYREWRPAYDPGTHRLYSNPSIGLFGHLAARSLGAPFDELMEGEFLPALGLSETHLTVPAEREDRYAWGYSSANEAIRVNPGVLDAEAYGLKASATDVLRYLEANLHPGELGDPVGGAITATHVGYHRVGEMTQGLGWESYPWPVELDRLQEGSSARVVLEANPVTRLDPPAPPVGDRLFHKTGSTNGFGAYVVFVSGKDIGLVLLANRNYPNAARIAAGHRILTALVEGGLDGGR